MKVIRTIVAMVGLVAALFPQSVISQSTPTPAAASYSYTATVANVDLQPGWTAQVGPTINPVSPNGYDVVQESNGIRLFCDGPAYSGWLAKQVNALLPGMTKISVAYNLTIDDATQTEAQVVEFDSKFTDAAGYTYDGSAQWNIAEAWMFQTDNSSGTWTDTGVKMAAPMPNVSVAVKIDYVLDYVNHNLTITGVTVNGTYSALSITLPAKQSGWAASQIVTQAQQVIGATAGAYSIKIAAITYTLSS